MKKSWRIAIIVFVASTLWVLSGILFGPSAPPTNGTAPSENQPNTAFAVQIEPFQARTYPRYLRVTGLAEAHQRVDIVARTTSTVMEIVQEQGTLVSEGEVIIRLDPEDREAQYRQAQATLTARELEFAAAEQLNRRGHSSDTELAQAKAALEAAQAALLQAEIEWGHTEIRAPFSGLVNQIHVDLGDFIEEATLISEILDFSSLTVTGYVAEIYLGRLDPDQDVLLTFTNGYKASGRIEFIGSLANPQIRTFPVEVSFSPEEDMILADGMTVEMRLPLQTEKVHFVPSHILALDNEGVMGVKTLDDQNRVVFLAVELVGETEEGLVIAGLPEEITLITHGQAFVEEGTVVTPVSAEAVDRLQNEWLSPPSEEQS